MATIDAIDDAPATAGEKARAKFADDTTELMADARFRRWLWHVIESRGWCGSFAPVDPGATGKAPAEPNVLYFSLGKRELGLNLQQMARFANDEGYRKMLIEAMSLKMQRELKDLLEEQKSGPPGSNR